MFEDVRREPSFIFLLSLIEPCFLQQRKFTDHENKKYKTSCSRKILQKENSKKIRCYSSNRLIFSSFKDWFPQI